MESIDALANAVNQFEGGLVLVSHDMRLISQVAKEIWICDNKTVSKYKGDIQNFKMDMRSQMGIEGEMKGQLRGDASVVKKSVVATTKKEVEQKAPEVAQAVATKKAEPVTKKVVASVKPVQTRAVPKSQPANDVWGDEDEVPRKINQATQAPSKTSLSSLASLNSSLPSSSSSTASAPGKYVPPHRAAKPAGGKYIPPHLRNRQ